MTSPPETLADLLSRVSQGVRGQNPEVSLAAPQPTETEPVPFGTSSTHVLPGASRIGWPFAMVSTTGAPIEAFDHVAATVDPLVAITA